MITIKFFAGMAERLNRRELVVEKKALTVAELRNWLVDEYPELADDFKRAMIAVNEEFAEEATHISDNDVVAFIPPVSGG